MPGETSVASVPPRGARFDDLIAGVAWVFGPAERVLSAVRPDELRGVLAAVDEATRAGSWAYGYVAYEAAAAFDPALSVHPPEPGQPLAWFAVCGPPRLAAPIGCPSSDLQPGEWRLEWSAAGHADRVNAVRAAIARGQVYQVNLTTGCHGNLALIELDDWYARMVHAQGGAYNALLDTGRHVIASASPELFFSWDENGLLCRPMKGTTVTSSNPEEDRRLRARLVDSGKERAENVMIVDLIRNDLAQVACTGSVQVPALCRAERYETVWQLTSDITARPRAEVGLPDVFAALFPSGSVTGAPKSAAMRMIAEQEHVPRGVYCGAIGFLAPPGAPVRARFNVAIRTLVIDRATGAARYGVGSGITWGSRADGEYAETLAKAAILTPAGQDFQLIETMRHEPGGGLRNLDAHLQRLAESADYFGFRYDEARARDRLGALGDIGAARVRVLVDRSGTVSVTHAPLPATGVTPVRLAIAAASAAIPPWCTHKTTRRRRYAAAAAAHPDADDVILVHPDGRVLETCIGNLAVRLGQRWWTPTAGLLLPGVERARLLGDGTLAERVLTVDDLARAEDLAVINSLRGWRPAQLPAQRVTQLSAQRVTQLSAQRVTQLSAQRVTQPATQAP